MDHNKKQEYLAIARQAAEAAGQVHKSFFGRPYKTDTKATSIDLVTEADLGADAVLRAFLTQHCPGDMLLTEETFTEGQAIDLSNTWVIDPLDGTTNFAHNLPHFAVSIAYFENGVPEVAVVYDAMKNECFYATRGGGAFLARGADRGGAFMKEEKITPSHCDDLSRSLLASGFPYDSATNPNNNLETFIRVKLLCHGVRRFGAAALDLAYVACGRFDGYWEFHLSPWDLAAGALIASEAGVLVTDLDVKSEKAPVKFDQRRVHILATATENLQKQLHLAVFQTANVK